MRKGVVAAAVVFALGAFVHLLWMWRSGWPTVLASPHGRDFASYYYAIQAASQGMNPYDTGALNALAKADGTRAQVYPFFYPPPYLLGMVWALKLPLRTAYQAWFWADGLFGIAAAWGLWLWRRSPAALAGAGVLLATFTPWQNSHQMGQANLLVLALLVYGLLAVERGRDTLGGALVGLACMMKMSPGLVVAYWLVRRQWRPALVACAAALALSVATLPLLDARTQWRFYTVILPTFSSGDYNGLSVPILMFGNHSVPNLWAQLFPGGGALSGAARAASALSNLAMVVGALAILPRRGADPTGRLCALGAIVVVMLLVPVYTYEHHMALLALPLLALCAAFGEGRLSWRWAAPLLVAYVALAWDLAALKAVAMRQEPALRWVLQEAKFAALALVGVVCGVAAGKSAPR